MPFPGAVIFAMVDFQVPFLAGTAVALSIAVPILVHLLFKQKPRRIEWAAMRFLPASKLNQRRRIDYWPLLLFRILALLLPLLAMLAVMPWAEALWQSVRPGVLESTVKGPRTQTIIVIDASLSMTAIKDGESRFENACRLALETVLAGQEGDGFSLIIIGATVEVPIPGPSTRIDVVQSEIENITATHTAGDMTAGLAAVRELLAKPSTGYGRRRVLVFGDLQQSAFTGVIPKSGGAVPEVWTKIAEKAELAFVDVAGDPTDNLAVTALNLADPLAFIDAPTIVTATVSNFGRADRRKVRVELGLSRPTATGVGPFIAIEQKTIDVIPSGGQASLAFAIDGATRFRTPGMHVLKVRLVEGDALTADDERVMAVPVRDSIGVLLVNGKPAVKALRGASDFLAEALAPGGRASPGHPIRVRTIRADELTDTTLSDFANFDCVILCDLPTVTASQAVRLESFLKRGGGVAVGLGPNAANAKAIYNRVLGNEGSGLLPGTLVGVRTTTTDGPEYRLTAEDEAWKSPPLLAFQADNSRAGLVGVPFRSYLRIELNPDAPPAMLSFAAADATAKLDPAFWTAPRHRGRVALFTSTFNRDWTDWPVLPSYLPFVHEMVRFLSANHQSSTFNLGESVEVAVPVTLVGQTITLTDSQGHAETATASAAESESLVRFPPQFIAGAGSLTFPDGTVKPLAFAIPESAAAESNLQSLDAALLSTFHPSIRVVTHPDQIPATLDESGSVPLTPRPHGPTLARWLTAFGLAAVFLELLLAWRSGPARRRITTTQRSSPPTRGQHVFRLMVYILLAAIIAVLAIVIHARITGAALAFLPDDARRNLETLLDVPASAPGEGVRWHLATTPAFLRHARTDAALRYGLMAMFVIGALALYRREWGAGGGRRLALPLALRIIAYVLLFEFVLPQSQLAFEREGDPDVVILIDTSESMSTIDRYRDEAKAKAAGELGSGGDATRLQLARAILTQREGELLKRLHKEKRWQIQVYSLADRATPVATGQQDSNSLSDSIADLKADGASSRLGDGIVSVLKANRGGALAGIILLSDGATTAGESLATAGRAAAKAGVPLFPIGIGETRESFDLVLGDLRADDSVAKNDELILEASLRFDGKTAPGPVKVSLIEKRTDGKVVLGTQTVTPPASGQPVAIKFQHRPTETGEKTYVLETPPLPDEPDTSNNRLEKNVLVTDGRKLRVLYLEGRPRYEFRFLKVLFEREVESRPGERAVDFKFFLSDAGKDFATTDRSALAAFPTRGELFEYDAIILGDLDPATLPKPAVNLQDLAEFVLVKGGGLLCIAGEQAMPAKYFTTPLAELLPVLPSGADVALNSETAPLTDGYRLKLTAVGRMHPLLRLAADDGENDRLWQRLQPLYWNLPSVVPRQAAEVLAVHPRVPGTEGHEFQPLILQQFQGAGRVMLFAFDETWRWRFRQDEELFNRFWRQALRVLARNRTGQVELRTDRAMPYRSNEPIILTARFPDDAPPPTGDIRVEVERVSKSGGDRETATLVMAKVAGSRASYQATVMRTPEGDYRFRTLTSEGATRPATAEAKVIPPPGEREQVQLHAAELERAATESRGKYYSLDTFETLIDELPDIERPPLNQSCLPLPLWNHPLVFATILSLLGLEWVLRKQSRLL